MRVLKVLFVILLLFTVIWSANFFMSGKEVPRFSTIQSTMQYYDTFTDTPTFLDVFTESIDKITYTFNSISRQNDWWKKVLKAIEGLYHVIALPIKLIIWLGGWLITTVANFTKFLLGEYIVLL